MEIIYKFVGEGDGGKRVLHDKINYAVVCHGNLLSGNEG